MTAWEALIQAPKRLGAAAERPRLRGLASPARRLATVPFAALVVVLLAAGMVGMLLLTTDLSHRGGIGAYGAQLAAALREVRPELPLHIISLNIDPAVAIPSDTTIADLARAYGKAYAAWVIARRETPNDLVETTMDYVDAERALRAAVCPKALAEEEALP